LVEKESVKNYTPLAITVAIKEYVTTELGLSLNVCDLRRKEVVNIKYKIYRPIETHFICNHDLKKDMIEVISYLTNQGYQVESYYISQRSTKGFVFAHPE